MSRLRSQLIYSDLTGGINNVDTKERINSTPKKTQTPDMVNVEYFGLGGIKSMEGNIQIGSTQPSSVVGGYEYTKGGNRYMMIATKDGDIKRYNDITSDFETVFKFEHGTDRVSFCNMNNGVIVSNGIDDLLFYEYGRNTLLAGTVNLTQDGGGFTNVITGTGTMFGTDCRVGDYINIKNSSLKYKIVSVDKENQRITLDKNVVLNPGLKYFGWSGIETATTITTTGSVNCVPTGNIYSDVEKTNVFTCHGNNSTMLGGYGTALVNGYVVDYRDLKYYGDGNCKTFNPFLQAEGYDYYISGIGIKNGSLYAIYSSREELIDSSGTWTKLFDTQLYYGVDEFVGSYHFKETQFKYIYGIKDGELRAIRRDSIYATPVVDNTSLGPGWTSVFGGHIDLEETSATTCAYGIQNGKLYYIQGTTKKQIGSYSDWESVYGSYYKFGTDVTVGVAKRSGGGLYVLGNNSSVNSCVLIQGTESLNNIHFGPGTKIDYFGDWINGIISTNNVIYFIRKNEGLNSFYLEQQTIINDEYITDIAGNNYYNIILTNKYIRTYRYIDDGYKLKRFIELKLNQYWTLEDQDINLNNYSLSVSNALSGDTITQTIVPISGDRYTKTINTDVSAVYDSSNNESIISNATNISIENNKLTYNNNTTESNVTTYRYAEYNRNSSIDTINQQELPAYTGLDISLSDISELNAYLINSDPEDQEKSLHKPIRGLAIQYYAGRLWVGGKDGLFYSAVGLPNNWDKQSDAGEIGAIYNDSSSILALGLWAELLMVHKEFSTYMLSCTGDSQSIEIKPFSNITCESQQSWIVSNTKYFVFSKDFLDIYPLVQRTVFSDKFLGEPISQDIRNAFKEIRIEDTENIFCVSRPRERQMLFYMPASNSLGSSTAYIFDFQTKSWLKRVVPQDVSIAFNYNNNIYIGTIDGQVLREFTGDSFTVLSNGEQTSRPINAYYKSPWFDWADGYTQSFAEFLIEIDSSMLNKFYIRTQKDGLSRYEDRIIDSNVLSKKALIWASDTDNESTTSYNYNSTLWDFNQWAKGTFDNIRILLPNNVFEDFQIEIGANELGQGFAIYCYGFRRIETEEAPW